MTEEKKQKAKEYAKKYYEEHKEKRKKQMREYMKNKRALNRKPKINERINMAIKYIDDKGRLRYKPNDLKKILKGEMTYK